MNVLAITQDEAERLGYFEGEEQSGCNGITPFRACVDDVNLDPERRRNYLFDDFSFYFFKPIVNIRQYLDEKERMGLIQKVILYAVMGVKVVTGVGRILICVDSEKVWSQLILPELERHLHILEVRFMIHSYTNAGKGYMITFRRKEWGP